MQLGHTADEIKYLHTEGTKAYYGVILDGEPTMTIVCDTDDANKTIVIRNVVDDAGKHVTLATKGQFQVTTKLLEDSDGMPLGTESRVDEKSVYTYIIPRLHVLLGRLLRAATAAAA